MEILLFPDFVYFVIYISVYYKIFSWRPDIWICVCVCVRFSTFQTRPGKSFGLKLIPNQSDLFRNLFPRQSELIRVNPKKVFNLVWYNSVWNQSVSIRVNPRPWIRMNPDQSVNPNESEVGILRIDSDWVFSLNHSDLGFIWIKNFFRIHSDWKSRLESVWFGLNFR